MFLPLQAGISIFGIAINPAILAFLMVFILFGVMNFIEYKRFD